MAILRGMESHVVLMLVRVLSQNASEAQSCINLLENVFKERKLRNTCKLFKAVPRATRTYLTSQSIVLGCFAAWRS